MGRRETLRHSAITWLRRLQSIRLGPIRAQRNGEVEAVPHLAVVSRRDKLIGGLDLLNSIGVEIGPLHRPVISKSDGHIVYVDHCDTESLKKKWASIDASVPIEQLHVDAVWGEKTLEGSLTEYGEKNGVLVAGKVAYLIASHVIEHVPDLIGWLKEVARVLRSDGQLRLAVPDRRFTFDYLRRPSSLSDLLSAHVRGDRIPNTQCILDFMLNMAPVDCASAWRGEIKEEMLERRATLEGALAVARDAIAHSTYHDVHCWVFTPKSFGQLCLQLAENDLLDFECTTFHDTAFNEFEFIVSMTVCVNRDSKLASWRRMIDRCAALPPALTTR